MPHIAKTDKPAAPPASVSKAGETQVTISGEKVPRLPHERDASADSSGQKPQESTKQAYADVKRGLVDTDKGPPMDQAYQKQRDGKVRTGR